ncbi:hypothetical protein K3495_g9136 [Podosphaera aphanis]|nr:hypothetical protein K3495_g9136 [Podosphaera aphanis]
MQNLTSKEEEASMGIYRIEYSHPETKPPVFIAGTFADSEWQPIEMNAVKEETSDEYKYDIRLKLRTGEDHQYKFRIGEGQWWVLNEDEPTVTDDMGNRNNLLQTGVEKGPWTEKAHKGIQNETWEERRLSKFIAEERKRLTGISHETKKSDQTRPTKALSAPESATEEVGAENQKLDEKTNTYNSENVIISSRDNFHNNKNADINGIIRESPVEPSPTPAAGNEKISSISKTLPSSEIKVSEMLDAVDLGYFSGNTNNRDPQSDDSSREPKPKADSEISIPLEKTNIGKEITDWNPQIDKIHQSLLGFSSWEQATPLDEQAPLLPHECINIPDGNFRMSRLNSDAVTVDSRPLKSEAQIRELDIDDSTVEIFPTDRASILTKILEIQLRLPEDETRVDQILAPNQTLQQAVNNSQEHTPALLSITEEAESTGSEDSAENKSNQESELKEPSNQEESSNAINHRDKEHQDQKNESLTSLNAPSHSEHEEEHSVGEASNIATESAKIRDETKDTTPGLEFQDSAKTTGFSEENSRANLRTSMNRRDIRSPERSITPKSKRSSRKDAHKGNFLKVFWRVIIIEWIGGMIMRFCGRGRRHT